MKGLLLKYITYCPYQFIYLEDPPSAPAVSAVIDFRIEL